VPRIAAIEKLVAEFRARRPIRSTSLIVTIFGDVVSQHGGVIWLGSLVEALGLIGIDERLVRTSTFRLVQEGWLYSERGGRRSFYRFTDYGLREYERAARRIYAAGEPRWEGNWTLLVPIAIPEDLRERFRRSVAWQGFGSLAPNLYAHPGTESEGARELLAELGLADCVLLMQATTDRIQSDRLIREVLWENWSLGELAERYSRFLRRFRPVRRALERGVVPDAAQCFEVRVLLIHEYRRILLHDTDLPAALLPRAWPGTEARELAAALYHAVAQGSLAYVREHLQAADAPMPEAAGSFARRFRD